MCKNFIKSIIAFGLIIMFADSRVYASSFSEDLNLHSETVCDMICTENHISPKQSVGKIFGILTTGGDCSGLNSIIRSAYIRAKSLGIELFGFKRGLKGLASEIPEYVVLNDQICDESMLTTSGSILYSDTKWIKTEIKAGKTIEDIQNMIYRGYQNLRLDGVICVGGDGSLKIINELLIGNDKMNIVAIPKTIDNDVNYTDFSVGFQTSVEVVADAIGDIRSTAKSHERAMVVEVMGRDAGFIAMYAGLASGADVILVPEFQYDIEEVKSKVQECFSSGKNHSIIVVAESVEANDFKHGTTEVNEVTKYTHLTYKGIGNYISDKISETGIESRSVNLGHIQRGGRTSINDRLLGIYFGIEAVNSIQAGESGKLLVFSGNSVKKVDIKSVIENINTTLSENDECVRAAMSLGTYIGKPL